MVCCTLFRSSLVWLRLFFCGVCMGIADIIPGISGGTIAFIMGFYEELIFSIKSLNRTAFKKLIQGHLCEFFRLISWKFLIGLTAGIVIAMVCLAHVVSHILDHEQYRLLLYATFFGLIIAASILCGLQLKHWSLQTVLVFITTATIAFFLTGSTLFKITAYNLHDLNNKTFDLWIIFCGAVAISAMLLPGISGSYLLTILGMYATAVHALADFSASLAQGQFDNTAFKILLNLLIGILLGALLFSRFISWILDKYHDLAIAGLTGFMIGALRSVWPFWDPVLPSITSVEPWIALILACCGAASVFILHFISNHNQELIKWIRQKLRIRWLRG